MIKVKPFYYLFSFSLLMIFITGCEQDNTQTLIDQEIANRDKYVNALNPKVSPTKDGLYYIQGRTGIGAAPKTGDIVSIYYKSTILNGSTFDQILRPSQPYTFTIGKGDVITGLEEGVKLMREGDTSILLIPSSLAYGSVKNGVIPAYSALLFEIELFKVN